MAKNGQLLLPQVELLEASRMAVDELIDLLGRAGIEAVLQLSAGGAAGEKHQGRKGSDIRWPGAREGKVCLAARKLRGKSPDCAGRAGDRGGGRGYSGPQARFEFGGRRQ